VLRLQQEGLNHYVLAVHALPFAVFLGSFEPSALVPAVSVPRLGMVLVAQVTLHKYVYTGLGHVAPA
jgi:hypothetical protein